MNWIRSLWNMYGEEIIAIFISVAIIAAAVFSVFKLDEAMCYEKTKDMSFASRWSLLGGCQIEVIEGQWIPLDSYYFKQE